jgi:hypothetical protein
MGSRHKGVLYGALNVRTGAICLNQALNWNQESFQEHLRHLKAQCRGWNIVLFLDRGSPHTAKGSLRLAKELGIELHWLPVACPELNPLSRTEPSGRDLATLEGEGSGQPAYPLDGGVDGARLWIHPIPFPGRAFVEGRRLVR